MSAKKRANPLEGRAKIPVNKTGFSARRSSISKEPLESNDGNRVWRLQFGLQDVLRSDATPAMLLGMVEAFSSLGTWPTPNPTCRCGKDQRGHQRHQHDQPWFISVAIHNSGSIMMKKLVIHLFLANINQHPLAMNYWNQSFGIADIR